MSIDRIDRRAAVFDVLRNAAAPLGIAEIAERLGVHANTVRFHLDSLVTAGRAERATAASGRPGRPHQVFTAVHRMDPDGPRNYRMLAEVLVAGIGDGRSPRARAIEIGRRWGREQAAASSASETPVEGRLVALLDDTGFAPESTGPAEIALHHCPFLDLAEQRSQVVCAIHLGLVQGALEAWGSSSGATLDPFVRPDLCLTTLTDQGDS